MLETVKDSDGASSESDVATGLLAPGMTGEFTIDITNNSEVKANYQLTFQKVRPIYLAEYPDFP